MRIIVVIFFLSLFYGYGKSSPNMPVNKYGESIDFDVETVKFLPANKILELKSYSVSCNWPIESKNRVIRYNRFTHALDILMLGDENCK